MHINSRGQADTVFEVLITVILLSFVLLVGSYAMTSLSDSKCNKEIDIALSDLSRTLAKVSSSALGSQYYNFNMPNCFRPQIKVSVIKSYDNFICSHYCPGSLGSCFMLKYENDKDKVGPVRYRCINISSLTIINDSSVCTSMENGDEFYEQIGLENNSSDLNAGRYFFSSQSLSKPVLCIYKQEATS